MNNRYRTLATVLILSATAITAWAQDETDALRFSYLAPQGTARSMGFGSALGSVGGDFTSLSVNPAGIGVYRTGEMMFTPSVKINSSRGTYLGATSSDDVTRFNIANFGMVFTTAAKGKRYEKSKWKASSFAIGFNRLADYNRSYNYTGVNSGTGSSSVSELFVADANNGGDVNSVNSFAGLGYQAYLLNEDTGGFYTIVPWQSGINQGRTVTERGRYNEWVISFGGNYMEKLLLGGTIGIPDVRYERGSTISESANAINTFNFQNFTYREDLLTKGWGANLKLGFIYKATDAFRFGGAIHTPTWLMLNDQYSYSVNSNAQGQSVAIYTDPGLYSYQLTTPWRGVISATGIIGKYGFVSADYEYVGYNTARFSFDAMDQELESFTNRQIRTMYKGASNFRLGAEARPAEFIMVRLGFGYYGSPYKSGATNADRIDISAGLGFRFSNWYADLGFVNSSFKNEEMPYTLPYDGVVVPTATLKHSLNTASLTIGFKF